MLDDGEERDRRIDDAVDWLKATPRSSRPGAAIPQLRHRFKLTAAEACVALRNFHFDQRGVS